MSQGAIFIYLLQTSYRKSENAIYKILLIRKSGALVHRYIFWQMTFTCLLFGFHKSSLSLRFLVRAFPVVFIQKCIILLLAWLLVLLQVSAGCLSAPTCCTLEYIWYDVFCFFSCTNQIRHGIQSYLITWSCSKDGLVKLNFRHVFSCWPIYLYLLSNNLQCCCHKHYCVLNTQPQLQPWLVVCKQKNVKFICEKGTIGCTLSFPSSRGYVL